MLYITNDHLDFLNECKEVFLNEPLRETHINKEETLIGLRYGEDRDCIDVYELNGHVAFFAQQIESILLEKRVKNKEEK